MAELRIKVSTEEVRTKATQILNEKAALEGIMNDMKSKVNQLSDCFKDEAGRKYLTQYTTVSKNVQGSLDALMKHTNNLKSMADTFDTGEQTAKGKVDALSADNIF